MASRTVTCLSLHGGADSVFCCGAPQMSHASGVCEVGSKRRRVSEHPDFPSQQSTVSELHRMDYKMAEQMLVASVRSNNGAWNARGGNDCLRSVHPVTESLLAWLFA